MKKVSYNIEFGHIYVDQKFSLLQRESSKIADKFIEKLKSKNETYATAILIDDYLPSYSYLDVYAFLEKVKDVGVPPDYVVYQTQLLSLAHKLIGSINEKNIFEEKTETKFKSNRDTVLLTHRSISSISLKDEYFAKVEDYVETPVLIAAWYLLRLGIFKKQGIVKETKYTKKVPFAGEKLLTIIPQKYKGIDETAKTILRYTSYKDALGQIKNVYF